MAKVLTALGLRKKPALVDTAETGIAKTSDHIQAIAQRKKQLENEIRQCMINAKTYNAKKNKLAARKQLEKKARLEKQLLIQYGVETNMERQQDALVTVAQNRDITNAMKSNAAILRDEMAQTNVDDVAETMDDISEQMTEIDQVGDAISGPIGEVADEDEITKQLEALGTEEVEELEVPQRDREELKRPPSVVVSASAIPVITPKARVPMKSSVSAPSQRKELEDLDAMM